MRSVIPDKFERLAEWIENEEFMTPQKACELLRKTAIHAKDLLPWSAFDHPTSHSYGRSLLYAGAGYEMMVMSWSEGDMAAIHDHGIAQWGAVQLFGSTEHAVMKIEDGILVTKDRCFFQSGSVLPVNHDLIHLMGNVDKPRYFSFHLYGCDKLSTGSVTSDAMLYDLDEKQIQYTDGGMFYHLPEEMIKRRDPAPKSDFPTYLRHQTELLKRLLQMENSFQTGQVESSRAQRIIDELFSPVLWQTMLPGLVSTGNLPTECSEKYRHIFQQELYACALLQVKIRQAKLLGQTCSLGVLNLEELILTKNLEQFSNKYLSTIEKYFAL